MISDNNTVIDYEYFIICKTYYNEINVEIFYWLSKLNILIFLLAAENSINVMAKNFLIIIGDSHFKGETKLTNRGSTN